VSDVRFFSVFLSLKNLKRLRRKKNNGREEGGRMDVGRGGVNFTSLKAEGGEGNGFLRGA
jgi:hypothetical protein